MVKYTSCKIRSVPIQIVCVLCVQLKTIRSHHVIYGVQSVETIWSFTPRNVVSYIMSI